MSRKQQKTKEKKGRSKEEPETKDPTPPTDPPPPPKESIFSPYESSWATSIIRLFFLGYSCYLSFYFRLHAVLVYGRVIHEFDPWFNFRATQYMVDHGIFEFFNWFDEMSWYPIGRHVGSTTYPGLLITSTVIFRFLNFIGFPMSINDVCVFVPAIFGVVTTLFTFGLTYEISGSKNAGAFAAFIMAIIPSHLMRSVAGGYDNESVALAAITSTFYLWVKSIKNDGWKFSFLAAFSYIYMVAAWGGYTFVINMIGLHAGLSFFIGQWNLNMYYSYSIFYFIGTWGAIQFPMVRWLPLQSMEQVMPLLVFCGYQVLFFIEKMIIWNKIKEKDRLTYRIKMVFSFGVVGLAILTPLFISGWFGPFSNRVRSLFIPHTRTGNPLVDSVSEHQATAPHYYWQYFHYVYYLGPLGFLMLFYKIRTEKVFGILYCLLAYYFSQKMVRLLLILSTPSSMASGIFLNFLVGWCYSQFAYFWTPSEPESEPKVTVSTKSQKKFSFSTLKEKVTKFRIPKQFRPVLVLIAIGILFSLQQHGKIFYNHCDDLAHQMSHPQILLQGRNSKGEVIIIDDFMQSYWWLRDHTPPDSRIMAWWDYGYQINGVANRTTIADGNTWNHEHIALLGKALVSQEKEAWRIAKHLADYVLVWTTRFAGMYGDDLAKMPHMANIAGSVYPEVSQTGYYIDRDGKPSELMRNSLLYRLTVTGLVPEAKPLQYFKEVFTSANRMVRIWKVLNTAPRTEFGKYAPELKLGKFHDKR